MDEACSFVVKISTGFLDKLASKSKEWNNRVRPFPPGGTELYRNFLTSIH